MKYLYHLTDAKNLPNILKNGLKPGIGERSQVVGEEIPAIYLSKRADIPYWRIILGQTVLLQISNVDELNLEYFQYSCYGEYLCKEVIKPENIKRIYINKPTEQHMKDLCLNYLFSISQVIEYVIRFYHNQTSLTESDIYKMLESCLLVVNRLDYSVMDKKEIKRILEDYGDSGGYTMVDTYLNTDTRLYEQICNFKEDSLTEKCKELNNFIKTKFKGCLTVNTGGWSY